MKISKNLLAGLILICQGLSAQQTNFGHSWAKSFGSMNATDYVQTITSDGSGNTYVGGVFSGSMTLNGHTASGAVNSAFLARFNNSGTCIGFTTFGGSSANVKALTFTGSTVYITGSSNGNYYVGKVSGAFGNAAAVNIKSLSSGEGTGLTNDGSNIYVTGTYNNGISFPTTGSPISLTGSSQYRSVFVAKFATTAFTTTALNYSSAITPFAASAESETRGIAIY
ncbi:MAG: hypothetical protein ACRC3B_05855, partial [Bacteroidia bacterium]